MSNVFEGHLKEMTRYNQWLAWKYVPDPDSDKPRKLPIDAKTGKAADSTDPASFASYADTVAFIQSNPGHGLGFALTRDDPYTIIDLDDTLGDEQAADNQRQLIEFMGSYTERSPSGKGYHIIVRGKVPQGRRKYFIEVYPHDRFMTMTGQATHNIVICDRQPQLDVLYEKVSPKHGKVNSGLNEPEREDDTTIYQRAATAENGAKFASLWSGAWNQFYTSQSQADLALINIIAFYTQNREQIKRMFFDSHLGKRNKAFRVDYLEGMITKSFDSVLEPIDITQLASAIDQAIEEYNHAPLLSG